MYKYIIFDVDGTLINTEQSVFAAYSRLVYEKLGKKFTDEQMKMAYGVPTGEALVRLGIENSRSTMDSYRSYLLEFFEKTKAFEGIEEILGRLHEKGIAMGVVSSRDKIEIMEDPCLKSLMKYFQHIISADDTPRHKPHPQPLLKVLELMGADISEALYIGDTLYDYMCARDAGVDFALALWGARDLEGIEALHNFKQPGDIEGVV